MRLCKKCCNELGMIMLRTYGGQCICQKCGRRLSKCGWCVPREEPAGSAVSVDRNVGGAEVYTKLRVD